MKKKVKVKLINESRLEVLTVLRVDGLRRRALDEHGSGAVLLRRASDEDRVLRGEQCWSLRRRPRKTLRKTCAKLPR